MISLIVRAGINTHCRYLLALMLPSCHPHHDRAAALYTTSLRASLDCCTVLLKLPDLKPRWSRWRGGDRFLQCLVHRYNRICALVLALVGWQTIVILQWSILSPSAGFGGALEGSPSGSSRSAAGQSVQSLCHVRDGVLVESPLPVPQAPERNEVMQSC